MRRKPVPHSVWIAGAALALTLAAAAMYSPSLPGGASQPLSFRRDVQPIFDQKCASCHPSVYPYLNLQPGHSYAQLVGVSPPNAPSYERVVPGKPQLSYLLVHPVDPSRRGLLTAAERRLIARWIEEGAKND